MRHHLQKKTEEYVTLETGVHTVHVHAQLHLYVPYTIGASVQEKTQNCASL